MQALRAVVGNGSIRRTLLAFFLFNAQEYAVWIAVIVYAFAQGGVKAAGAILVAQLVPAALVAPFTAMIGDRMRRDRALSIGYAIQTTSNLVLALALWKAPAIVAYAAAVLSNCAITFTRPVHNSLLPQLADTPRELAAANAVTGMMDGLGGFVGPIVTSVILVIAGSAAVVAVMAGFAATAALITFDLKLHAGAAAEVEAGSLVSDAMAGFRELRAEPSAAFLVGIDGIQYFLFGLLDVFYALLAIEILAVGSSGTGVLAASFGVGGLVGAGIAVGLAGRARLAIPMAAALVVCGATLGAIAVAGGFPAAVVLLVFCGAGRSVFDVAIRTLLQRSVRDEVLARVFGVGEALQMIGLAIGAAAAPILVAAFGGRGAVAVSGVLLIVLAIIAFPMLIGVDARAKVPGAELAILRAIPIFAPLPEHIAEQLSWNLIPLQVAAGSVLIRQGDEGDRFYILSSGDVDVTTDGRSVARLGPGGYFGEIALLRDVPRTASVVALTDCRLLTLERDMFLGAITGSVRSLETAHAEIDRRLDDQQDQ